MSTLSSPSRLFGLTTLAAGVALTLTSAVYVFSRYWHAVPAAAKFALAGAGIALCLILALIAERKQHEAAASTALFATAIFTGIFWIVFGQTFQSGATFRDFCLIWAASTAPLFLLRRRAPLWNLLILLLSTAVCSEPVLELWRNSCTSHLLKPLLVAATACVAALLPPSWLRRSPGLNAWLALPLTLLLAESTALCTFCILFLPLEYHAALPELVAGPLALAAVLTAALRSRHALALCELALCGVVLLNAALFRLLEPLPATDKASLFLLANIACTFFLIFALPKFPQRTKHPRLHLALTHAPALFGGFAAALSLLIATTVFFSCADFTSTLLLAGLVYTPGGVLLWKLRRKSVFFAVFGAVLVTGGTFCLHIGLLDKYPPSIVLPVIWATAVALYLVLDYAPLRFSAVFWALASTIIFVPLIAAAHTTLTLPLFFFCFLPLVAAAFGRFPRNFLRPAAFACFVALPLFSSSFSFILPLLTNFDSPEEKIAITLAALNLGIMLLRRPPSSSPARPRPAELAASAFVLLALWHLCTLENLVALNLLAAGVGGLRPWPRAEVNDAPSPIDRTMLLFGALALIINNIVLYYVPAFSFRSKILSLGVPGLCLLFAGLWMEHKTHAFSRSPHASDIPNAPLLRQALPFALCAAVLTLFFSAFIWDRLHLLHEGKPVLLPLKPQDRQIFMLDDSMDLHYEADCCLPRGPIGPGCLPLEIDAHGTASPLPDGFLEGTDCSFVDGPALTVEKTAFGDHRLRLPRRWHFEGDLGIYYEDAAFAVLLFDKKNRILLQGLADDKGRLIHPPKR